MNDTNIFAKKAGFLNMPRAFWVALTGLAGVILCAIPNWISATIDVGFLRDVPIKFNFLSLFGDFGQTGLYYLFDEDMSKYTLIRTIGFVVFALLVIAVVLIITGMIKYRSSSEDDAEQGVECSPIFTKLVIVGLGIASFAALLFAFATMIFSGEIIRSGLTLIQIAAFLVPLVTMPFLLDPVKVKNKRLSKFLHQKAFFFMIIPVMVYVFIFNYLPLTGWQMAFQIYRLGQEEQEWAGLFQFEQLFRGGEFWRIMQNTLGMSVINLVLGFTTSIFLALMINEVRQKLFKRVVQTISYLPHFLSWVIAAAMIGQFLSTNGILNQILVAIGVFDQPKIFLADIDNFWWTVGWSGVWKSVGWNTIIYLAAITAIDPELYESAELDGAGRFAKMWHITLPGIKSTVLVLVIMNIGWILNAGYEVQFLLGNDLVWPKAETIDVFVIRRGMAAIRPNYSLATALGMFKTVVSIILIAGANQLSKAFAKESLV